MRLGSIIVFVALCSITAYYIYAPIPEPIEERWKLMLTDCFFRSLGHLAYFSELLGLKDYMGVMHFITVVESVSAVSDERVHVSVEKFDGVEVVVYQPKQQGGDGELRRAVIYFHGGGWCVGGTRMAPYDFLARQVSHDLGAVVVSVEYRLSPAHHFPTPFEDVYQVVKHFLQQGVLAQYSVDPKRIAVSGDSAGGNLAAAVAQQLMKEPGQQIQFKVQALIYPVLQALDLNTPSYQQNQNGPILPRTLMVRFWSEYFTSNRALFRAMMTNTHNNQDSARLLKFVNWYDFLPKTYHGNYSYSAPVVTQGGAGGDKEWDGLSKSLIDPRASPLLVPDAELKSLPKAYIMTCEYDVLRDDGIMYVTRLRAAGVEVSHEHYEEGFHGAMMFTTWPTDFLIAHRIIGNLVKWLEVNL